MKKAGTQETPQKAITRLASSVIFAKFSNNPCFLPTAFRHERATTKWMSSRSLIAELHDNCVVQEEVDSVTADFLPVILNDHLHLIPHRQTAFSQLDDESFLVYRFQNPAQGGDEPRSPPMIRSVKASCSKAILLPSFYEKRRSVKSRPVGFL